MKNLFFKNYCRKLLIFLALSIVVATLIFSLCACDVDGADELPTEIVSSNYEFSVDLSPKGKTEFYFTPKFSGDYVVTIDDENATFLIDGVEISERIVYFSKKEKYDIVRKRVLKVRLLRNRLSKQLCMFVDKTILS